MTDDLLQPGVVELPRKGGSATVDVDVVGPIGVRVRRVRVDRETDWDLAEKAGQLGGLRALPERVAPVEIDPTLGGAILRTVPEELRGDGYFEVEVGPRSAEVRRVRLAGGEREAAGFDLTREQLHRLLDELDR